MGLNDFGRRGGTGRLRREALDVSVDRIDHGNSALDDANLTQRLADVGMVLTACPISNVKLAGVDKMANHPLKTMLDKGLAVTVNSDDPAYFGGYINDNYRAVQKSLNLSIEDLHRLARTSFTGSFLSEDAKAAHLAELDAYVAGFK